MTSSQLSLILVLALSPEVFSATSGRAEPPFGILLLGEAGDRDLSAAAEQARKRLDSRYPVEFAPGWADRRAMQKAADALQARRVKALVAVPLAVASASEVMDQVRFLLGIRETPSKEFMAAPHAHRGSDDRRRVEVKVPVVLAPALDQHELAVAILAERARGLSRDPAREALLLVGAAPAATESDWLASANALAEKVRLKAGFKAARAASLKTDAPQKEREKAENDLRSLARSLRKEHGAVVVVPLDLTRGGLAARLGKTLEGAFCRYDGKTMLPDPRLIQWIEESALRASMMPDMRAFKDAGTAGRAAVPPLPKPGGS